MTSCQLCLHDFITGQDDSQVSLADLKAGIEISDCACAVSTYKIRIASSAAVCGTRKKGTMVSALHLCLASALLATLQASPTLLKSSASSSESNWFDLLAPDVKEKLEGFPLYEYAAYEDYEYGNQIWSDCSKGCWLAS